MIMPGYRRFAFEGGIHETLDCVPMAGRRMLDLARLKISLAGWQALPAATRRALLDMEVDWAASIEAFAAALREAAESCGVTLSPLAGGAEIEREKWSAAQVPGEVAAACAALGVALDAARWAGFDEDERFAIVKLADPKRDRAKLQAALVELGVAEGPAPPIVPATVVCR